MSGKTGAMLELDKNKIEELRNKIAVAPKEHPFMNASLCELYCYDEMPTYVTDPAYDAYTLPIYDAGSRSFIYAHHDMEAMTRDDVILALYELVEELEGNVQDEDFVKLCSDYGVSQSDIDIELKDYQRIRKEMEAED